MELNRLEQQAFGKSLLNSDSLYEDLEVSEENLLAVGIKVVMDLSQILQNARRNPESVTVSRKGDGTRQTNIDVEAQRRAMELIKTAFPDHSFIGEEGDGEKLIDSSNFTWIIDPIDSTNTFLSHENICAICLSLVKDGKAIFSIVMNPFTGEIFHTYDDQASRLIRLYHMGPPSADDLPLQTLDGEENLRLAHVHPRRSNQPLYDRLREHVQAGGDENTIHKLVQTGGSPAYQMAAVGKGFFSYLNTYPRGSSPWEMVPGSHIVTNVRGAVLSDEKGGIIDPFNHTGIVIASARRELHDLILRLIN